MGAALVREQPKVKRSLFKHTTYTPGENSITVVYGRTRCADADDRPILPGAQFRLRTPEDCILVDRNAPGAHVKLACHDSTICILKIGAIIQSSGVIDMARPEALLRMGKGASIQVGNNARLVIYGMLLMEDNARLEVHPGAMFTVSCAVHLAGRVTIRPEWPRGFESVLSYEQYSATWSHADQLFIVHLIRYLCYDHGLPFEVALPLFFPVVCRRYGVLMLPGPYEMPPHSPWACSQPVLRGKHYVMRQ